MRQAMWLRNKKTGGVGILMGSKKNAGHISLCIDFQDGEPEEYIYASTSELNDEWEDYESKEPLIKDKRIRKAVRVWAEANEITFVDVYRSWFDTLLTFHGNRMIISFTIETPKELRFGETYTIEELCGSEE